MFFKERFACYILFSYQCSFRLLISHLHQQLCYNIMCCKSCQQLFSTFFKSFSLFQRRHLNLIFSVDLLLPCSATLDNIHPGVDKSQHHFLLFFQNSTLTVFTIYIRCFCAICTVSIFFSYFLNEESIFLLFAFFSAR